MPRATVINQIPIPRSTSTVAEIEINDYSKGINTYVANDVLKDGFWRLAQDARIIALGEYQTRQGLDYHSDAAGETLHTSQTTTTGAADQSFNSVTRLAQRFTTSGTGRCTKVDIRLKNSASATGTVMVELWSETSSAPGALLARSSVAAATVTGSYTYLTARFVNAPALANSSNYWIVCYVQARGINSYSWSSTSAATTASLSTNSGSTWAAQSFALNFKAYMATDSVPKGFHRAYKSDGTAKTLIVHGTTLYSVDDATGALTSIKTGLSASATKYRFVTVNDTVYYVNGFDGLRKWNFTTESQVNLTNYSNILVHKGLLFLNRSDDPNRWDFSNFALYETFTSTDFIYVPSPKTGDPCVAGVSLNGTLIIFTRHRKYILYGSDNATFQLEEAPGKKGTFSQETIASDKNFAYFVSDDGEYSFNGTEDKLLSQNIYEDSRSISNKSSAIMTVNRGRLYLYYASPGSAVNDSCIVFNLNFNCVESYDTNSYVAYALTAFNDNDKMIVASSVVGQAFYQELSSNDYTNLGGDINFELRTHYMPFKRPSVPKALRFWKPRFGAQAGDYDISCLYAYDLRENPQGVSNVAVLGTGPVWGSGIVWGSFIWGSTAEVQADLTVPGEYRRIQLRYKHYATRQPHRFLGQLLVAHIRGIR